MSLFFTSFLADDESLVLFEESLVAAPLLSAVLVEESLADFWLLLSLEVDSFFEDELLESSFDFGFSAASSVCFVDLSVSDLLEELLLGDFNGEL